jgi:fucose 4-O-acetylase-like acetyltransferase
LIDKKQRDAVLDSIKGFLIILVVFGLLIETSSNALAGKLYQITYAFHMPCFVFTAGINAKSDVKSILIRISNISVLTVIWIGIYSLYVYKTQGNIPDSLTPFWIIWFMVSLISWNILLLDVKYFHYSITIFCGLLVSIFVCQQCFLVL